MKARFLVTMVVSAGLLATSIFAAAQGNGAPPPRPGGMRQGGPFGGGGRERMLKMRAEEYKKLHLTAAQRKKIDAYDAHIERVRAANRKPNMDRAAMRPMMEKMRAEHDKFMRKVLTPAQFAKWQADMKAMRGRMGGGRGPRPGAPGGPPPGR